MTYEQRIRSLLPGINLQHVKVVPSAGMGTDAVFFNDEFVALFSTDPIPYSAHRNAEVCQALRPHLTVAVPQAVAEGEGSVVFRVIAGIPLERNWLLRQPDATQQRLADQIGRFLRELGSLPREVFEALGLKDYTHSMAQYREEYDRIKASVFPVLGQAARNWARNHFESFFESGVPVAGHVVFQHADLVQDHMRVDPNDATLTGVLDFGSAGLGDPAGDLSNILLLFGESFAERVFNEYPQGREYLDHARFLVGFMHLKWVRLGLESNDCKWFLHHLGCAMDLLPIGTK